MSTIKAATTWRVALVTRVAITVLAAFMYGFALVMFAIPFAMDEPDHSGDWMVDLAALVVTGFGIFATFALVAILRTRVTLDNATLDATVVDGHSWFLFPHMRSVRIPLTAIRSVERRSEIFRALGLSSMRDALSIVTTGGERIGLFSNTLGSVETMPIDDVAAAIATAAGTSVTDDGTVRVRGYAASLFGEASSAWTERPLDDVGAAKARRTVMLTVQITTALLLLTFILRALL